MLDTKNENEEKDFPGYPHYPSKDDIMNRTENERVDYNVDHLSKSMSPNASADKSIKKHPPEQEVLADVNADDVNDTPNDADLTTDDLIALGQEESNSGKLDPLEEETDLDVPGSEDDDANEEIGEEDEENNYYSIGGDDHENLEEDKS